MRKELFGLFIIPLFMFAACGPDMEQYGPAVLFRGDPQRQGRADTPGPLKQPLVKWKFKTGGEIWSSPVEAGGVLFFRKQR